MFSLVSEGVGRGERYVRHRKSRTGVARLFEPEDGIFSVRLQEMR